MLHVRLVKTSTKTITGAGETAAREQRKEAIQTRAAYSPVEFAALFGRSATWAYRRLYEGAIQAVKIGGRMMIPATEADKLIKAEPVSFGGCAK